MATEPQPAPEQTVAGPGPAQQPPPTSLPPQPAGQRSPGQSRATPPLPRHGIRHTRISGAWIASICFAVVLLLLLIFILQNSHMVDVSYLGAHWHLPLGVALLLASVFGVLLIALPGTARIVQLRRTARRHRRADTRTVAGHPASPSDTDRVTAPD